MPDPNQRALAGEYYVAYLLNVAGYETALTIGSAKSYDLFASGPHGSRAAIQVKANLWHYDWLVRGDFPEQRGNFVVFVRLPVRRPALEVYVLTASAANRIIDRRYRQHSPRVPRRLILHQATDHDLSILFHHLDRECA